jgi:elongation factor G
MKAYSFEGSSGEIIKERPIPADMQAMCEEKRTELIEKLAEVDEEMAEKFLGEEKVDGRTLRVRRAKPFSVRKGGVSSDFESKGEESGLE